MLKIFAHALTIALFALPLRADPVRVVTDIAPVHSLVSMVMQGVGTPDIILPPGASAHHYSMRPSHAAALENADLIFWVGPALTPWLAGPLSTLASNATIVSLQNAPGTTTRGETNTQNPDMIDPHLWLSPENAIAWIHEISTRLAEHDPENSALFDANTLRALDVISVLRSEIIALTIDHTDLKYITFHDSLGYFEHAYALPALGHIVGIDETPPSPQDIASLRQRVRENNVTCIVAEPGASPGMIANVFGPVSPQIATVDPLGAAFTLGPHLYPDLIRSIAQALATCD